MSSPSCEIKSIRQDIVKEVIDKMSDEDDYHEIANLFKLLGDYNRVRILCALNHHEFCVC